MIYDDDVELISDALHAEELGPWDASHDIARAALDALDRYGRLATRLTDELRGDGPCRDCGTEDNIRWFTDSTLWNTVIGGPGATGDPGGILCIPCFVSRTDEAGYWPRAWRLLPEWHWETRQERNTRIAEDDTTQPDTEAPE